MDSNRPTVNTTTSSQILSSPSKSSPSPTTATPTTPLSLRQSVLYDSPGTDDDHERLLRHSSSRTRKFIIIPSTVPAATGPPTAQPFRPISSVSSLAALAATINEQPTQSRQNESQSQLPVKNVTRVTPSAFTFPLTSNSSSSSDTVHKTSMLQSNEGGYPCGEAPSPVADVNQHIQKLDRSATSGAAASINATAASASPAATSTFGVDLRRPKADRKNNTSTRSVVSACIPQCSTANSSPHHDTRQTFLRPSASTGRDLGANSFIFRDSGSQKIISDVTSVRSLAAIGIGSTDGRRLVIRRVPHTPDELFGLVHPPSPQPIGTFDDDDDSFMDISDDSTNLKPRQQHWANKMQFVLACVAYSVGLGNVWRFPYMCYKSGGGVFLIPYCIILIVCSVPLLFMELAVGQYTGRGPIGALGQLCPLFKGAGLASVVISFLMSTYYSVIIGYSIFYFFTSFKPIMPWTDCNNRWNTPDCWVPQRKSFYMIAPNTSRTPSEEFFENKVLQISRGIEQPGMMRWELLACLVCAWIMVYFATWKSIKSSAKVRYFTATFPFVLIVILMMHAVTLEGADAGLRFFFQQNWSELKKANIWINAVSQNFNSLGITLGSMISFASYNKYSNNILQDTVAVSVVNVITSLLVGIFAFATIGNLALEQNTNVGEVIGDGPGLIFVVYPQAMAKMPYAQLWAVMFFFMLLCLGLNSQFAIVEVVVTSMQDGFPNWIKRNLGYNEILVMFVCVISFLCGLPNLVQSGMYFFQLMDHYAASVSIMFLAFCQMIAVAWFYGVRNLSKNIKQMTGKAPSLYIKSCWAFFAPCLLFAIWILSLVNYHEPTYHNGRYKYPEWAYAIGWIITSLSLACIPGYAVVNIMRSPGETILERIKNNLRPNIYECKICGEHHCEHDYSEQEQYMLAHEMTGVYQPKIQLKPLEQHNHNQNTTEFNRPQAKVQRNKTDHTEERYQHDDHNSAKN